MLCLELFLTFILLHRVFKKLCNFNVVIMADNFATDVCKSALSAFLQQSVLMAGTTLQLLNGFLSPLITCG